MPSNELHTSPAATPADGIRRLLSAPAPALAVARSAVQAPALAASPTAVPVLVPDLVQVLVALLVAPLASAGSGPPLVAITTSAAYMGSADLAMVQLRGAAGGGDAAVDTLLRPEDSNRAMEALRTAEELVSTREVAAVVGHSNSSASIAASQICCADVRHVSSVDLDATPEGPVAFAELGDVDRPYHLVAVLKEPEP